jgi:hypothetical protein
MDAGTYSYSYWRGWKDARAGFPPQAEEYADPDAYHAGYEHGSAGRFGEEVAAALDSPAARPA